MVIISENGKKWLCDQLQKIRYLSHTRKVFSGAYKESVFAIFIFFSFIFGIHQLEKNQPKLGQLDII
jgi:catabolite regulation protein CreA